MRIGIVGGSISGCAACVALLQLGHRVEVFERAVGALEGRGSPTDGSVRDGRLLGRGAADSKIGVAIFAHIFAKMYSLHDKVGRLSLMVDGDEPSAEFNGIKKFMEDRSKIDAVYIGYPGSRQINTGARGFARYIIESVFGLAARRTKASRSANWSGPRR